MSAAGIPQIAAVMGSCTAGGAYVPAMSDESIIVREQGTIFLGGPPLVKAATGEVVTAEELGGGDVHARMSGVVDHLADDDEHALAHRCARSSPTLPPRARAVAGASRPGEAGRRPGRAVRHRAADPRTPYDVREVIAPHRRRLARSTSSRPLYGDDPGVRLRAHLGLSGRRSWPTTASCSRESALRARTSSSCATSGGSRCCSCRTSPGFMVGRKYEAGGIAKDGAKLVTAVASARCPS